MIEYVTFSMPIWEPRGDSHVRSLMSDSAARPVTAVLPGLLLAMFLGAIATKAARL